MNPTYFDIHAHLQFKDFDTDRDEVIKRAEERDVGIINIATGLETSKESITLAEKNENMWAAVGHHPIYILGGRERGEEFNFEEIKKLANHPKVVTIGECGIDLFHNKRETLSKQIEIFEQQLQIAKEVNKPAMLHLRDSYKEALEVLKKNKGLKANAHFFAGTIEEAKQFLDLGHTISFTGVITFAKQYEELVEYVPLENIMAETDCPYVAPAPHRGERNEPVFVIEVYKKIAEIKKEPVEKVTNQIRENVKRVFKI